jgi:hypothetical protein
MDLAALIDSIHPPLSYVVFGGAGGILYILRQKLKGYRVRPVEYLARPIFGATAAFCITVALKLPNHFTSLFVGYFGIDAWDALAARFDGKLPLASKHEPERKQRKDEDDEDPQLPI